MCELCRGGATNCVDCLVREQQALPDAGGRAQLATIALIAGAAVDVLGSIVSAVKIASGPSDPASLSLTEIADGLMGLLQTVVFITTAVLFLRWWFLMAKHATARGIQLGVTPGWAVGFWFIPFANLAKPPQIARAAATGFGVSPPIAGWWALWVLSNVASQISARLNLSELKGGGDVSAVADLAAQLLSIPAALLCISVVRTLQRGLSDTTASTAKSSGLVPAAA
jgi:hypothetical protein